MLNKIGFLIAILFISTLAKGQLVLNSKLPELDIDVKKYGVYIGLQRGEFSCLEVGGEYQYKKIKLLKPYTHAAHFGFNYNFDKNVLGYDVGYWFKEGRLDLTYGVNGIFRTDYKSSAIGFAPVFGFKFTQLHIQTGYNFLTPTKELMPVNRFFISIRFVFIKNRDWSFKRK